MAISFSRVAGIFCGFVLFSSLAVANVADKSYQDLSTDAATQYQNKDLAAAISSLQLAVKVAPDEVQKANALFKLGQMYKEQRNDALARGAWMQILLLNNAPKTAKQTALTVIGGSFLDERHYANSRQYLTQVVADDSADKTMRESAQLAIVSSYKEEKNYAKARAEASRFLEDKNADATLRLVAEQQIADSYVGEGNFVAARKELTEAEATPALSPAQLAGLRIRLIQTYVKEGDGPKGNGALNDFQLKMLQRAKESLDKKDYADARESFAAILTVRASFAPADGDTTLYSVGIRLSMADTYLTEGSYEKAKSSFSDIIALDAASFPADQLAVVRGVQQNAQIGLARTFLKLKSPKDARQIYQHLIDDPLTHPGLKKVAQSEIELAK